MSLPFEDAESLKVVLETKYRKCNLQFTRTEREYLERECGFTDEELVIFQLRTRGFDMFQIALEMDKLFGKQKAGPPYSIAKVEARIRRIKNKIIKVL